MNRDQTKQQNIGIEVKITDHCNLSCFHCMNNDGPLKGHNIEADVFIKSLIEFQETRKAGSYRIDHVRMTGRTTDEFRGGIENRKNLQFIGNFLWS